MGLFDKVTKSLNEATEKVKDAAKSVKPEDIQKGFAKIADEAGKTTKAMSESAARIVETAKTARPEDIKKNAAKMVSDAGTAISRHNAERKESQENAKAVLNQKKSSVPSLTVHDALVIVYLMMSADKKVTPEEEQTFESVGKDMDPEYDSHKYDVVQECSNLILDAMKNGDYDQNLHDSIAKTVWNSMNSENGTINGKLMVWNLEAIGYADGIIPKEEQSIIQFVAKELKIDDAIFLEMEAAAKTLLAIGREEQWLKDSDRTYSIVEPQMNELEIRKGTIMQGIHALLTD